MKCVIEDCGQLLPNEPWNFVDNDETQDTFPPDPRDLTIQNCQVGILYFAKKILKLYCNSHASN